MRATTNIRYSLGKTESWNNISVVDVVGHGLLGPLEDLGIVVEEDGRRRKGDALHVGSRRHYARQVPL